VKKRCPRKPTLAGASCRASRHGAAGPLRHRRRGTAMGKHGDGKGGAEGDRQQSPKESDGQWTKPVTDPPKK